MQSTKSTTLDDDDSTKPKIIYSNRIFTMRESNPRIALKERIDYVGLYRREKKDKTLIGCP